jgi:hypothetical protein
MLQSRPQAGTWASWGRDGLARRLPPSSQATRPGTHDGPIGFMAIGPFFFAERDRMDEVSKVLIGMGLGGILVAALLYLTRDMVMVQLPKYRAEHIADLKSAHETCETKLSKAYDDFKSEMRQERADNLAVQGKMIDRLASLESILVQFVKEFKQ